MFPWRDCFVHDVCLMLHFVLMTFFQLFKRRRPHVRATFIQNKVNVTTRPFLYQEFLTNSFIIPSLFLIICAENGQVLLIKKLVSIKQMFI